MNADADGADAAEHPARTARATAIVSVDRGRTAAEQPDKGDPPVRWFAPRDLDDVDRGIKSGEIGCVRVQIDDLLRAMWDERVDLAAWRAAGVEIELRSCDGSPAGPGQAGALETVQSLWMEWNAGRKRRAAIAGLAFCIIAAGAAFALVALA